MENQFIPIITSRITHRTTHSNRRRKSMRIRDYIRDVLLMGQKRNNKSGLPRAAQGGASGCWHAVTERDRKFPRGASQHHVHEIKACISVLLFARFFPTSSWLPLIFATLSRMLLRLRCATRCAPYIYKGLRYDQSATDIFYAPSFLCH